MKIGLVILSSCMLILFACAPTKVEIYSTETPPEKNSSERISQEKTSLEETALLKPRPQRPSTGKLPTVTPPPEKTYDETISEWKSYQELVEWMEDNFSVDIERFKRTSPIPRTPKETFHLKSGIDIDAAMFLRETLNRVNPSYQAQIVIVIIRPNIFNRYVCSFKKDGKLFIMDYGTPHKEVTGVNGPYKSLEEYKEFYESRHPIKREIEAISYLP